MKEEAEATAAVHERGQGGSHQADGNEGNEEQSDPRYILKEEMEWMVGSNRNREVKDGS